MTINLTDPANHPANGPLTVERIARVRDELQRTIFYASGGVMDYIVADAIKGLEELLVSREAAPVLPDEMAVSDDMNLYQKSFAQGHNACRAAMLQPAMNSEFRCSLQTAPVLGSLLKNTEFRCSPHATQDCWCRTCRPLTMTDMRFVVCPNCGNKRCPHANDHRNSCTGSNEPGQEGSAYPAAPQEVK